MSNMNVKTPVFFPDRIKYMNGKGSTVASIITGSGFINFQSGTIGTLHNGKPLDTCSFDTTGDVDGHVLLNYNFGTTSWRTTYVAVLNHNLVSCAGKIRVFFGDAASDVQDQANADADLGSVTVTEVLNAGTIEVGGNKSIHVQPTSDGTTIIKLVNTLDSSDFSGQRYVGVQFEGNTSPNSNTGNFDFDSSTDLIVGCVEIGEIFDLGSPDLNLNRSISFDKINIEESIGGQKYANISNYGRFSSSTSRSPFSTTTSPQFTFGGRISYDLSFSFLDSSDIMPSEYGAIDFADDSFVQDVWNMTSGNLHPFIFSVDSTSTGTNAESEFLYARFNQNKLDMRQVAFNMFNVNLSISEEF